MKPDTTPWWEGTVIPTGRVRLKRTAWGELYLQHLVRPSGGERGRWVDIETKGVGASDDE